MSDRKIITIERHIIEKQREHAPEATGMFTGLLNNIAFAAKVVAREVRKAGLVDILGMTGDVNVQGEEVQKLDEYAQNVFYRALDHSGYLCVMASEESDDVIPIPDRFDVGPYVFMYDPLDGSSNIDANVSIGTIFSIHRRVTQGGRGTTRDCLQPGSKQVASGYILYGSSTMLVYTAGHGVYGFTLDPSIGEFLLSHPDIRIRPKGKIYSINEGNYNKWDNDGVRKYVDIMKQPETGTGRPYTHRYIGSMVADIHRTLLYGGIFLYPGDKKNPNGKLRLLYEAAPMSYVIEQAGGKASTGFEPILDIQPAELHQRVPLVVGSPEDVDFALEFIQGKR